MMAVIDTRPAFWKEWEQLGCAVAAQAACDYAKAKKREIKEISTDPGGDHYDTVKEMHYYKKFFESGYFTRICPNYDGKEIYACLESGGWKKIVRMYRYSP